MTELLPTAGLEMQLKESLAALPFDLTSQADQIADFVAATQHPLTGGDSVPPLKTAPGQPAPKLPSKPPEDADDIATKQERGSKQRKTNEKS